MCQFVIANQVSPATFLNKQLAVKVSLRGIFVFEQY